MQVNSDRGCLVCPYCATEWLPDANFEGVRVLGPGEHDCPLCHTKLSKARLFDFSLLYCEACQGMLVQIDDLALLTSQLRADRDAPPYTGLPPSEHDLDRQIDCPFCRARMDTHAYYGPGNVIIDTCEPCSVHWLDRGELHRMALAPDHHYVT